MRTRLFFYLLGVMVGDASKGRRNDRKTPTMEIDLLLSKRHDPNVWFGEFVAMCINSLGLQMNRVKDRPSSKQIPNGAYRWRSQSSLLVRWILKRVWDYVKDKRRLTTQSKQIGYWPLRIMRKQASSRD